MRIVVIAVVTLVAVVAALAVLVRAAEPKLITSRSGRSTPRRPTPASPSKSCHCAHRTACACTAGSCLRSAQGQPPDAQDLPCSSSTATPATSRIASTRSRRCTGWARRCASWTIAATVGARAPRRKRGSISMRVRRPRTCCATAASSLRRWCSTGSRSGRRWPSILAAEMLVGGVILEASFTSVGAVAAELYGWLPIDWLDRESLRHAPEDAPPRSTNPPAPQP